MPISSFCRILLFVVSAPVYANFTLSVLEFPDAPGGYFTSAVVGSPGHIRNPCYGDFGCRIFFYIIDESWLPGGKAGYSSLDRENWTNTSGKDISAFEYLDTWWVTVDNKGRVARDFLPYAPGTQRPCMVLAAGIGVYGYMKAGSIVSNCAKGIVQARSCRITSDLQLNFGTVTAGASNATASTRLAVSCEGFDSYNIVIETNTGERVPLSQEHDIYAELDWGLGYGKPGRYQVEQLKYLNLVGRLRGRDLGKAGYFRGSTVVSLSYD